MLAIMKIACFGAVSRRYQVRAIEPGVKSFWFGSLPKNTMQDHVQFAAVWER